MKKILSIIYCFLVILCHQVNAKDIPANISYDEAEYETAAKQYKELLIEQPSSYKLWYNLGNAYYKSGDIGYAIAAYRKAHKLNPTDEDIIFNLNFAFSKTSDKIEPAPKSFIVRQTDIIANIFTSDGWALACTLFAVLGLAAFLLYIFMRKYSLKKLGLFSSIICWGISFLCLAMAAHRYYYSQESYAVIVIPSTDILAEPNENGTRLLLLNEGATLQLQNREGDWVKVELPNGTIGYVKSEKVEII